MHDTTGHAPDLHMLFQIASGQMGYFTANQAREVGVSRSLLHHHTKGGKFERMYHGVYRFRDYPSTPREEVAAAWLAVGKDHAVVSHESALDLLDLTDIIPYGIHIVVPRKRRYVRHIPGITIHTTIGAFTPPDFQTIDGVRATSATRTIVDVASSGQSPEHVDVAVAQALDRGLTSIKRLQAEASARSKRVQRVIEQAIENASP